MITYWPSSLLVLHPIKSLTNCPIHDESSHCMLGIQFQDVFYWWSTQNILRVFMLLLLILCTHVFIYLLCVYANVCIHTCMQVQACHCSCVKVKCQRATLNGPLSFFALWDSRIRIRPTWTTFPVPSLLIWIYRPPCTDFHRRVLTEMVSCALPRPCSHGSKVYWPSPLELPWMSYQPDSGGPQSCVFSLCLTD